MKSEDLLRANGAGLAALLSSDYGLDGAWSALDGERDGNLRLATAAESFLVKVAADDDPNAFALQLAAIDHLAASAPHLPTTRTVPTRAGEPCSQLVVDGAERRVWVSRWLPGDVLAAGGRVDPETCEHLGRTLGELDRALQSFDHPLAERALKWDLLQADWIAPHLDALQPGWLREAACEVHEWFLSARSGLAALRRCVVHNDANDHNVLLGGARGQEVVGLVDFGDMCRTALVSEPAIAASYLAMHARDPLTAIDAVVRGYHDVLPLREDEVAVVVPLVALRLVVSAANAAVEAAANPDDAYVTVSQRGVQRVLRALHGRDHHVADARLRAVCGWRPPAAPGRVRGYLEDRRGALPAILPTVGELDRAAVLDLSFDSVTGGDDPTRFDAASAAARIEAAQRERGADLALGRYGEPRPIYTDAAFGDDAPTGPRRTVHLGVDVFAPAGADVATPLDAVVHDVDVCEGHLDYGGLVVLRHRTPAGDAFGTLYGHLDPASLEALVPGQRLEAGDVFATLGEPAVNGGWPPHLHLQVLAADPRTLPPVPRGVADPDDLASHHEVYPDPSALLGLPDDRAAWRDPHAELTSGREARFARNLKTSYDRPLTLVRGWRHQLFDSYGRRYLDAYNNVPHVGHAHPRVARAVAEQTAKLATNTRYLHGEMQRYAERLRALLPDPLEVFFFTPSGSEANELALRLARRHTGRLDVCVMDHGYHGHTTATMELSPYKFRQAGAPPQPEWVHVTAQPDVVRGEHRGEDAPRRYGQQVRAEIAAAQEARGGIAAYLCECLPSVGGQLELPDGFLQAAYDATRAAGGLCIADDVQTGLWRTGDHAFGFERHGVVPDLLVLGKPLGNGFPLGAVVTTRAVAESFADGPEFFSTFGGSTVAMAAGNAVLDVLADEGLAENARVVGGRLLAALRALQEQHTCIGDVRGRGFFLGVELVEPDTERPARAQAAAVKNRLRAQRVLIGTDGPHDNVLKIRPPMTFDAPACERLVAELDVALRALR
ncbi:MAG: aminotransferase class III-fold pyridoxal phosphate-dependent enzyme [Planctomycetota bacterium]